MPCITKRGREWCELNDAALSPITIAVSRRGMGKKTPNKKKIKDLKSIQTSKINILGMWSRGDGFAITGNLSATTHLPPTRDPALCRRLLEYLRKERHGLIVTVLYVCYYVCTYNHLLALILQLRQQQQQQSLGNGDADAVPRKRP
jgi:hypothetical protein